MMFWVMEMKYRIRVIFNVACTIAAIYLLAVVFQVSDFGGLIKALILPVSMGFAGFLATNVKSFSFWFLATIGVEILGFLFLSNLPFM